MKKIALSLLTAVLLAASYIGVAASQSSSSSTAPGLMPRGTVALPGMYFAGDRDTGFYRPVANGFAISLGGVEALFLDASRNLHMGGHLRVGDGSAASPAYHFESNNAGIFLNGGTALGVATNSTLRAEFQSDGDFAVDTNTFFVDAVNNRVGVGLVAPASEAHIASAVQTAGYAPLIVEGRFAGYGSGASFQSRTSSGGTLVEMARVVADGESSWDTTAANQDARLSFWTTLDGAPTERARITSDGTVLVGSTTDQPEALHVTGDFEFTGVMQRNGVTFNNPRTFTAVYDPASLAADTSRCDNVTVTGITTTGGAVAANIGAVDPAAGCVVATVRASATDTVRVCWRNANAGAACDTASSTWSFTQAQ